MDDKKDDLNLNLTREQIDEDPWYFSDEPIMMPKEYSYNCSLCRDTKIIEVYGGRNKHCDCGEKIG